MANNERKKEYDQKYKSTHQKIFAFRLSKKYDADLIELYESIPNKTQFIRDALVWYAEQNGLSVKSRDTTKIESEED